MPRIAVSCFILFLALGAMLSLPARAEEESLVPPAPPGESVLIAAIEGDAPWEEKQAALRGLRVVGTAKAVPALARLLPDPEWSHFARYALEPIPDPAVDAALRDALDKTEGPTRAGVAISLGVRRDAAAVPLLERLLTDPDPETRSAAAGALGRIGTPESATVLFALVGRTPPGLGVPVAEGLLAAAGHLAAEGHAERATLICERVLELPVPMHVRMGAFRGLADADPANATDLLLGALAGDEPVFRDMAAQIVAEASDDTARFAAALEELPNDGKIALLRGLAARGDREAREAVLAAAASGEAGVRAAALRALARLGTPEDVPMLIAALDGPEADATAARDALRALDDDAVNALIAEALDGAPAPRKVALLELLGVRVAPETLPAAVAATGDPEAPVRDAGLRILADLGGAEQLPAALTALANAGSDDERTLAARATSAIASRQGEAVLGPLLVAMAEAPLEARLAVLRAVAQVRTPKALEAIVAVIGSGEAEAMRREAVRLLATWTTTDAAPHLLTLAKAPDSPHRDAALRGYVRLARGERDAAAKQAMLETAMNLASGTQEQWLVLAAWGTLHTPAALDALRPHLSNAAVRNEAASAMLSVAAELGKDEAQRPAAKAALDAVLAACDDAAVRERATAARAALGE